MKIKKTFLCMIFLWKILVISQISFAETVTEYNFYKEIITTDPTTRYKEVFLDNEVYQHSKEDLSDLKIVNDKNENVPFYVIDGFSYAQSKIIAYPTKLMNKFSINNDALYDFQVINPPSNRDVLANVLKFSILTNTFAKTLTIYGSYDNMQWDEIITDKIYAVENVVKTEVKMEAAKKYLYYRIKIPNNLEKIDIEKMDVSFEKYSEAKNPYQTKQRLKYDMISDDSKINNKKMSLIKVYNPDKLRISTIKMTGEGNFRRNFKVYKNAYDENNFLGVQGEVLNLSFKDTLINKTDIDFMSKPISNEIILIAIENKDDAPLKITSMEVTYFLHKLVFENKNVVAKKPESKDVFRLYFGNRNAELPYYDIRTYQDSIEKENKEKSSLGKIVENPIPPTLNTIPEKTFFDRYAKLIFNSVIVMISIILAIMIARKLKSN